jgi:signal transduction histidine kinase
MAHPHLLSFVSDLVDPADRPNAARALAQHIGADDLMIFLPDAEIGALLPAPGFPQTMSKGQEWRNFLGACHVAAPHSGELLHAETNVLTPAVGITADCGAVLILLGGEPRLDAATDITLLLPLLAAAFRGERTALIAASNSRVAAQAAENAKLLADSLDKARAALRAALSDAEMANRAKDRFLAALSHELRTPLTPVLLAAAAAEGDTQLPESVRRDMAMIRRNVELEVHLIDDLLDLSRVLAGKLRLRRTPLDLNTQIRHAAEICRPHIQEKGAKLRLDLASGLGLIDADPTRLQQVLWNLLKNAVKFSPDGEIVVTTRPELGGRARVTVRDKGIGIEPAALHRIFEAFEQESAETPRDFGGLGLGLAICKSIVDLHGGSIRAESKGAGHGAEFTVDFPLCAAHQKAVDHPLDAQPTSARKARILIVEDHADTARLIARILEKSGHTVRHAGRVDAALEILGQQSFDILLSDVGLPDRPGYELMQAVKVNYGIPGIAMTGYAMEEDVRNCHAAGFSEHLVKPVDLQLLEQTIERVLAGSSP